jgi:catechol 2,3-dioxygenase-like lactoylglutathione lyase family enzyme
MGAAPPVIETDMAKPVISGIAPLFIVKDVPAALAFYRDRLGFDVTFQGPEPDDIFFGIVRRGAAMIMFKHVGVDPVPNYPRDVKKGIPRWDAYLHVLDGRVGGGVLVPQCRVFGTAQRHR